MDPLDKVGKKVCREASEEAIKNRKTGCGKSLLYSYGQGEKFWVFCGEELQSPKELVLCEKCGKKIKPKIVCITEVYTNESPVTWCADFSKLCDEFRNKVLVELITNLKNTTATATDIRKWPISITAPATTIGYQGVDQGAQVKIPCKIDLLIMLFDEE